MRTYDIIFILDEKKFEDGGDGFARDVEAHLKSLGGTVKERSALGRRTFARPIGRIHAGAYWEFIADLDPAKVSVLQEKYRLNAAVLRMQVLAYTPPPPARASAGADTGTTA